MKRLLALLLLLLTAPLHAQVGGLGSQFGLPVAPGRPPATTVVSGGSSGPTDFLWTQAASGAVIFDAIDDYASGPATGLPTGERTLMAWVFDNNPTTTNQYAMAYGNNSADACFQVALGLSSAGTIGIDIGGSHYVYQSLTRSYGWRHIAITIPAGTATLSSGTVYVDGIAQTGAKTYSGGTANTVLATSVAGKSLVLGENVAASALGKMKLAEVSVWSRALSQAEINQYMMRPLVGNESGLVRYYKCDERSGNTLVDAVSGVNATLSGATWTGRPGNVRNVHYDNYIAINDGASGGSRTVASNSALASGSEPFSVMCWFYLNRKNAQESAFSFGSGVGQHNAVMYESTYGMLLWQMNTNRISATPIIDPPLRTWHHIAFAYPGGEVSAAKVWYDGALKTTSTYASGTLNTSQNPPIYTQRSDYSGINYGDVYLAELVFFNKAISDAEVARYYNYRFLGNESGVVAVYHLNEGTGTTCNESKYGAANLSGGALWGPRNLPW